jgi:hypothetical protein
MIALQGPIDLIEFDETLDVFRDGEVIVLDGKPIKRDVFEFKIICNVQPMNSRDLLMVPEWDRYKEQYWLYTNNLETTVYVSDRVQRRDTQGGDQIVNFEVQSIENWGSYQRVRIMRIDVGKYKNE